MSLEAPLPNQQPKDISGQKTQEINKIRPQKLDRNRLRDMSTVVVTTYSEPQTASILQFENIVKKVDLIEKGMQYYESDRVEIRYLGKEYVIDRETVDLMKVGANILYNILVAEGLKEEADNAIYLNTQERDNPIPLPPFTTQ